MVKSKTREKKVSLASSIIMSVIFIILSILFIYIFLRYGEPQYRSPQTIASNFNSSNIINGINLDGGMSARLKDIETASMPRVDDKRQQIGRLTGSAGNERTQKLILDTFNSNGLTVFTQEFDTVVPVTEKSELLDLDTGKKIPEIKIYPFEPSGLMTATTSETYPIEGHVLIPTSSDALELASLGKSKIIKPDGTIETSHVKTLENSILFNKGIDSFTNWIIAGQLGAKAIVITEGVNDTNDIDFVPSYTGYTTGFNTMFNRYYARGDFDSLQSKNVKIDSEVKWETVKARNIIGIFRGKKSKNKKEALIITAYYDSYSNVPDLSPGGEQAISLAAMLQFVKALSVYSKLPEKEKPARDVIFIATAAHGQNHSGAARIMSIAETISNPPLTIEKFNSQQEENEKYKVYVEKTIALLNRPDEEIFSKEFREKWLEEDLEYRRWVDGAFKNAATDIALKVREDVDIARVNWTRDGSPTTQQSDTYRAYQEIKQIDTRTAELATAAFTVALDKYRIELVESGFDYFGRFREYLNILTVYHNDIDKQIEQDKLLFNLFRSYSKTFTVNIALTSGGKDAATALGVAVGRTSPGSAIEPQSSAFRNLIARYSLDRGDKVQITGNSSRDVSQFPTADNNITSNAVYLYESSTWLRGGRLAFSIFNNGYFPYVMGTPRDTFDRLSLTALNEQLPIVFESLLSISYGSVDFKELKNMPQEGYTLRGNVYTALGSGSVTPSNPLTKNTVVSQYPVKSAQIHRERQSTYGVQRSMIMPVNPYGAYYNPFAMLALHEATFAIDAVRFNERGYPLYIKDNSPSSQSVFKNTERATADFSINNQNKVNLAMFRATIIECYQRGNPKTLNSFARFDYLRSDTIQSFTKSYIENDANAPSVLAFLAPESVFYVGLMDGSPENTEIQSYRAFMLNSDLQKTNFVKDDPDDIYGNGYLAADTPVLQYPYFDAAESMVRTNAKRIYLQEQFQMDDEQMQSTQGLSVELLKQAREVLAEGDVLTANTLAGRSLAAAMSNHPVIKTKISNAIIGVIWYLLLLVPFAFFFEKLIFGFTDIRKQLVAIGITFIAVFGLLSIFHPAFRMVASPIMILLGFLICLLAVIITIMVTGKFKQIITAIRSKEGNIEGADINRSGVIGTAFMLGLNNMRRRKVRTGLTSLTLILITFVMICFTSISSPLANKERRIGKSASNGIMRRDPQFIPLTNSELANWQQLYGLEFPTTEHYWLTYVLNPLIGWKNPEIVIDREYRINDKTSNSFRQIASSAIGMSANEPAFSGIDQYLTAGTWFTADDPERYIIIPDRIADSLEIKNEEINAGIYPDVVIRNFTYKVKGVFDSQRLDNMTGMDGKKILPYDLNTLQTLGRSSDGSRPVVPETVARIRAEKVIITNDIVNFPLQLNEQVIAVSCSVLFPTEPYIIGNGDFARNMSAVTYSEQRQLVDEYLERTGEEAFYAIDDISYFGSRTRTKTIGGLVALLIPILIAALTVFNTMRGSVYERKDEIYVYNAVGIAPNHIFFMFIAEACVYAVIGALAGYLLSQIVGSLLTTFNVTAGLNMDYSSIETIYASLAIVIAVMLSTIIPARAAAELASPSDEASWTIPVADGDTVKFQLPFTFTPIDRIATLSYFYRWLMANSEGSSGPFYSSPPHLDIVEQPDPKGDMEMVPMVIANIWLKPFDLGVSQKLTISLPTDEATHEYIASIEIERIGGSVAAWERTITPFLKALRKQFLNWRAVTDADRTDMFNEAKELLKKEVTD